MHILIVTAGEDAGASELAETLESEGHLVTLSSRADAVVVEEPEVLAIAATVSDADRIEAARRARGERVPVVLVGNPETPPPRGEDGFDFDEVVAPTAAMTVTRLENLARLHRLDRRLKKQVRGTVDFSDEVAEWRALIDGAPNVIMRLGETGLVEYANRPIAGNEDPRGQHFSEVFDGDVGPTLTRAFHKAIELGEGTQEEIVVTTADVEKTYLIHMGPVLDRSGTIGASLVVSDVTEQRRSSERAHRYVRRLDILQEHLPLLMYEGVIRVGSGVRLEKFRVHGSHERIPLADEEPAYDDWMGCIHPDDWEQYHAALRSVGSGELSAWTVEYRWRNEEDEWIWMLDRGVRVERKNPRIIGFAMDISDRKSLESQLAHAQKMEAVGRLAGGVAHDFNNLLTSIINFTWYVRDELPEESSLRGELSEVLTAAESGAQLTGRLLAFSKRRPVEPETIELNDRLTSVHNVLRRTLGEDVELVVSTSDTPVEVMVDPGQFDQLLFNLAVNARDAMEDGGELAIELTRGELDAVLEISDNGVGIPPDQLDQVFDPFFTTKGEEGTGLGLATCYGIVSQANGQIEVESETGEGTTFTIRLPLADVSTLPVTKKYQPLPSVEEGTLALVVEDQPAILRTVTRTLEKVGYTVQGATTSEEALVLLDESDVIPQVLISDVVLPGLSGPKLADKLRDRFEGLRVILMSGYLGEEYEAVAKESPHTLFLPKPFTPAELLARLAVLTGEE